MSISIRFLIKLENEPDLAIGQITLGNFVEEFEMSLTVWNRERYEQQWKEGIQRILNGAPKSCLIASLWGDKGTWGFSWWPLYRIGDQVVAQSALIWDLNMLDKDFDPDDPYQFIREHISMNEDGQSLSEWSVPFDQVAPQI